MNINIRLNKNFSTAFNRMLETHGEELAKLNGFSDSQLSYTDFIDNFIDKSVADASIDGNSNVSHKDIVTLENEMSKPHSKLLVFNKIFYEINKKYGFKAANDWIENEWDGHFYLHDSYNASMKPYSYKGSETVVVKYNDELLLTPFENLYDIVKGEEVLLSEEDSAYCKYVDNLFVWDVGDTWTKVVRVIKKPKTESFHFIKTDNGISEVVTSNHPVITTGGDKNAVDITDKDVLTTQPFLLGGFGTIDKVYCLEELRDSGISILFRGEATFQSKTDKGQVCCFCGTNPIQNEVELDFDLGWLIGMIIAEGSFENDCVSISQNKGKIFDNILNILESKHLGYCIGEKEGNNFRIKIRSGVFCALIKNSFMSGEHSWNKTLNPNILKYNKTFIKGIIGGILDGDGTLTQAQGRRIHIRMTSRGLINQLAFIIRMFGYTVREQTPSMYDAYDGSNIVQHRYIYHLAFTPYSDGEMFDSIKIKNHSVEYTSKDQEGRYTNGKYTFGFGEKQVEQNFVLISDKDKYVYDISVETGHFMCNGILSHNCYAYDLERLVKEGLFFISNFNNQPPKHLCTYTDFVGEFVSWACNRSSGAVGLPSFLIYSFYFWKKDSEEGYFIKSPEYYRNQSFQEIIYRLNQPFLRSGIQSAFTNFSIFDKDYLVALFGGNQFPDGTFVIDYIDEILEYQKAFMEVVSEIRSQNMMTFPVLTFALLRKDGKFVNEDFARWCCDHNMKWADSNFYISEDVTSLSNCCLEANEIVLTRSDEGIYYGPIAELYNGRYEQYRRNLSVFHNGSWSQARVVKLPKKPLFRLTTANGKSVTITEDHLTPTLRGDIRADKLTTEDYVMFNTQALDGYYERDNKRTYAQGFLIGAYAGDGSHGRGHKRERKSNQITLSLNRSNEEDVDTLNRGLEDLGIEKTWNQNYYGSVMSLTCCSEELYEFIMEFVKGGHAYDKSFDMRCLYECREFRKGIVDGWMATDGGNSNRIYSVSKDLIETGDVILQSLGMNTAISLDESRVGLVAFEENGKEYSHNYPLWCVRYYENTNRRRLKDVYIRRNNSMFFKIENIECVESEDDYVYCFEMKNTDEPYFTLPNGMITHNCRLVSDIKDLGYFNSIGGTALEVGSVKVNTINLARIAYESKTTEQYLEILKEKTLLCLQCLDVIRHIIDRNVEKGLLPNYTLGMIKLESQYNTIGIIGIYEALQRFKLVSKDEFGKTFYTDKAISFAVSILKTINDVKVEFGTDKNYKINIEEVPAERAAAVLMEKDRFFHPKQKYELPLYGNQWIPLGVKTTLKEKIRLSAILDKACSGGSIAHIGIDAPFNNFEMAWEMLNYVADQGVPYFAFCTRISACKHNHGFYGDVCPICGESKVTTYQRIVGFLTPESAYSGERKKEFLMRDWMEIDRMQEM